MAPPINKQLMSSRPLYDPDPDTFVARDAVTERDLRRVRLSDFAVVTLQMHIQTCLLSKVAVDIFENVYVRGAKIRVTRLHEGRPALAPDGTVMSMGGVAYPGSTGQAAGQWNTENVKDCPGYDIWLAQLTQDEGQMVARGLSLSAKNTPFPNEHDLLAANAYVPTQMQKATKKEQLPQPKPDTSDLEARLSRSVESNRSVSLPERSVSRSGGIASQPEANTPQSETGISQPEDTHKWNDEAGRKIIDLTVNSIDCFSVYVETTFQNPSDRKRIHAIMNERVMNALAKMSYDNGSEASDIQLREASSERYTQFKLKRKRGNDKAFTSSSNDVDGNYKKRKMQNEGATEDSPSANRKGKGRACAEGYLDYSRVSHLSS